MIDKEEEKQILELIKNDINYANWRDNWEKIHEKIDSKISQDEFKAYVSSNRLQAEGAERARDMLRDIRDEEFKEESLRIQKESINISDLNREISDLNREISDSNREIQKKIAIILLFTAIIAVVAAAYNGYIGYNQIYPIWPHVGIKYIEGCPIGISENTDGSFNPTKIQIEIKNYGTYPAQIMLKAESGSISVSTKLDNVRMTIFSEDNITGYINLHLNNSVQNFSFNFWVECTSPGWGSCDFWPNVCGLRCEYERVDEDIYKWTAIRREGSSWKEIQMIYDPETRECNPN